MALTPTEHRTLTELAEHLSASDPRLSGRLSQPMQAPQSAARELAVITVLLAWMAAGLVPIALGVAWMQPPLLLVGVITGFVAAPAGMWATLRWVRRHHFVAFRDGTPQ
ncbi:DUF3040 domain-containing protein [Actinomycetospora endophytica]|uniref:DUF3040 domain-containing protein n=1 Tax=Actinomycetospora endophytica TaxID=2291215 RepID=A0ABS8PH19_9PSEU|nr:DUF3040 domain-containing protein [Actinomycetospora endophytica]MCD2197338.1 DUF3040 domain-containing protein [Actinomycetospora endophytica]